MSATSHRLRSTSCRSFRARAERYYTSQPDAVGFGRLGDSRDAKSFADIEVPPCWVVTSPPYYGMRTYVPDQWLRHWFLGGPAHVEYTAHRQLDHRSPDTFAADLRKVWANVAAATAPEATMVVRLGGIAGRAADPTEIIRQSFVDSGWRVRRTLSAASADVGRRQALAFRNPSRPARARVRPVGCEGGLRTEAHERPTLGASSERVN